MASIVGRFLLQGVSLALLMSATGCAEMKALVTVLFTKSAALSTSAFEFDEIHSGSGVVCASFLDKSMRCLGSGSQGNLGTFNSGPADLEDPVVLATTGKEFTCIVTGSEQKLSCFGRNDAGQLGNSKPRAQVRPVPVGDLDNGGAQVVGVKEISAGDRHACALLKSGRAVCWGDNSHGQLGSPMREGFGARTVLENDRSRTPVTGVKSITAGANSTCMVLREDSAVFCFGERYGSKNSFNWVPARVEFENQSGTLNEAKAVGLGRGFGCALTKSSKVYCWGRNDSNQLGVGNSSGGLERATEVQVAFPSPGPLTGILQITVGESHACALHREGRSVFCWGKNDSYQLGNSSARGLTEQVAIGPNNLSLKEVREVRAGPDRTCIISMRGEVFCWGNGRNGLLGNSLTSSPYPVRVLDSNQDGISGAAGLAVGHDHSCLVEERGRLFCFGVNSHGQMGSIRFSGKVLDSNGKPVTGVTAFDVNGSRTCLIHGDQQGLGCFGASNAGLFNEKIEKTGVSPIDLKLGGESLRSLASVSHSANQICVIGRNQVVTCQPLGEGAQGGYSPVGTTGPIRDLWQIRTRARLTCALTQESGEIHCWRHETVNQVKVAELALMGGVPSRDFISLVMSNEQVCGIRGAGREVFCGGIPDTGQVNLSPLKDSSGNPLKGILVLSGGDRHVCGIRDTGGLVCWGDNSSGQLGLRNLKESQVAVQVDFADPRLKQLERVSAGEKHTCVATPREPALFCFGESFFGGSHSVDPVEYAL